MNEPVFVRGRKKPPLAASTYRVIKALIVAFPIGLSKYELAEKSQYTDPHKLLADLRRSDADWAAAIDSPGRGHRGGYRLN
jgi:hypothetical protein